jgi:CO/xanthine dehydrogenase Mo-binding subunit
MTIRAVIGDTPRRREDARFTTGRGGYLNDLRFDDVVHAVVLRSPHAHARIERHCHVNFGLAARDSGRLSNTRHAARWTHVSCCQA